MGGTLRIRAGELTSSEILDAIEDGRRVIVEIEVMGADREVALRERNGIYYCDTPTVLHTHESLDEMRECIEGNGYGSDADRNPAESDPL